MLSEYYPETKSSVCGPVMQVLYKYLFDLAQNNQPKYHKIRYVITLLSTLPLL